ncbi:histidine phosphatase family protein [methane-oxidizing endosymbiont of Gigantopelta aegis]|uniref:histidine phosphatase family protein n=1 Tax=methane-oxidizing endosymbiont of Gigantopelta aegis TaxID=2794938 RepID=UPI0018DC57E7|nr:alpha-ribazole phosphatase family protein [methane-oxidizing endosymbiont of Gigantopelta aegis]
MNKTVIDLLRHGEVQGGACFRGSQDDPLTEAGWQQMQQQTQTHHWQAIISSPLKRCRLFAEHLSQEQQIPLQIEDNLREIHFGDWEGKSSEEINQLSPQLLQQFYQNPMEYHPPAAEPLLDFQQRVTQSWHSLLNNYSGQHILLITHAGVIRLLFSMIFKLPYPQCFQFEIPAANLTRFSHFKSDENPFTQLNFHQPPPPSNKKLP